MEIITDKSIFDINNPYPEVHKLNPDSEILIFNDFLKKPDEYKDLLMNIPAFASDYFYPTSSPGWRQLIPYEFYNSMEKLFSNWTGFNPWVEQGFTNLYKDNMPCNCKAWYPHHDNKEYVVNLWLSDGPGGTGFYTWQNHYQGVYLPPHIQEQVFSKQVKGDFEYEEFTGDECWNLYHMEPLRYNRAIFYNGNNFHSAYLPKGYFKTEWRYSLVLMGGVDEGGIDQGSEGVCLP